VDGRMFRNAVLKFQAVDFFDRIEAVIFHFNPYK
jgi:hypothetical protein